MSASVPKDLYHTVLNVKTYHDDTGGITQDAYVLATHGSPEAAKAFARVSLKNLNYQPTDFTLYEVQQPRQPFEDDDSHIISATTLSHQQLLVSLVSTPNSDGIRVATDGTLILPDGERYLHYVLQNTVNYSSVGPDYATEIKGCYKCLADALKTGKGCLVEIKPNCVQYDERETLGSEDEWPFGKDVVVHAVSMTGESYTISVRTGPGVYDKQDIETSDPTWRIVGFEKSESPEPI